MLKKRFLFFSLPMLFAGCQTDPVRTKPSETIVEVMVVPKQEVVIPPVAATLEYREAVPVVFTVSGELESGAVILQPGTRFRKGQLLFQINNTEAYRAYRGLKKQLSQHVSEWLPELDHRQAVKWQSFYTALTQTQLLPELPAYDLSSEETAYIRSSGIEKEYLELIKLEEGMKRYFFLAPFDGIVLETSSLVGKTVRSGQSIALIGHSSERVVWFTGQEREPDSSVNLFIGSKRIGTGRLEAVHKQANGLLRFYYKPQLSNPGLSKPPIKVQLGFNSREVYVVPQSAVRDHTVCLIRNGKIVRRAIRVHSAENGFYEISGLTEADTIATNYPHTLPKGNIRLKVKS